MPVVNAIVQPVVNPIVQAILGTDVVNGASFDGTNDYLTRGADLTGNADSKVGLVAMRIKAKSDGSSLYILEADNAHVHFWREVNNKFRFRAQRTDGIDVVYLQSTTIYTESNGYINIIVAWDGATTTTQLYAAAEGDPVSDKTDVVAPINDVIDYTATEWNIGSRLDLTNKFNGDINFLYCNFAETLDISVEANRRKFFDADGNPVLDVAGDGSSATGTAPIIYQAGTYDQWENNKGSGGGFIVTGALTEPVD